MKTVPTLAATSGTLVAAVTGLAFGVTTPSSFSNTVALHQDENVLEQEELRQNGPKATKSEHHSSVKSSPLAQSGPLQLPEYQNSGTALQSGLQINKARNSTGHATEQNTSPTAETNTFKELELPSNLRRSRSGLHRLSSLNFSRSSSPLSSFRPDSRSFTFSSSSSTPMLSSDPVPTPSTPNKLVKRSFSLRKAHTSDNLASNSQQPPLKRPATSHQRSATLFVHSGRTDLKPFGSSELSEEHLHVDPESTRLKHLFVPRVLVERTASKPTAAKSSSSGATVRRIYPKDNLRPILVLGRLVDRAEVEFDDAADGDRDLVIIPSRPTTPATFERIFQFSQPEPSTNESPASDSRARRPQLISGFFSRSTPSSSSPTSLRMVKDRLKRRVSRRTVSGPPLQTTAAETATDGSREEAPPSKRRQTEYSHSKITSDYTHTSQLATVPPEANVSEGKLRWSSTHRPATPQPSLGDSLSPQEPTSGHSRRPASSNISSSSVGPPNSSSRNFRSSMTPSDMTSSQLGSEGDARIFGSGDEDDGDLRSDTVYDSVRTGITRSSSGLHAMKLETLFDKDLSSDSSQNKHSPSKQTYAEGPDTTVVHGDAEGESSVSSPVKTVRADDKDGNSSHRLAMAAPSTSHASTSDAPKPLSLGRLEWDSIEEDTDSWSDDEAGSSSSFVKQPHAEVAEREFDLAADPVVEPAGTKYGATPERISANQEPKINLFEWSEQQTIDRGTIDSTPPRPKTVHGGKKDAESRTGRVQSRAAPAVPHARSQSVPVTPEQVNKNLTLLQKFGTWGIGTKGVTESWNEDFEFDDPAITGLKPLANREGPSSEDMVRFVPKTIRDQQSSVLQNINLLKEWGLLIEELKDLRKRVFSRGLQFEGTAELFDEVDGMIDLADHEAQEDSIATAQHSMTSSPGFDPSDFEPRHSSARSSFTVSSAVTITEALEPTLHETPSATPSKAKMADETFVRPVMRPRQDSEAMARSVIEALHHRHDTGTAAGKAERVRQNDKLPFDTATLKHIVPHVSGLVRRIKRILREAEGLSESPNLYAQDLDETFRPGNEKDTAPGTRLEDLFSPETDDKNSDINYETKRPDLLQRMNSLKLQ